MGDFYMAKDLSVTMLLDVYGQLLTEKQQSAIDMYYNEDLSLAEIADEIDISRQGVLASIKQGEKHLTEYENALGVVKRFQAISAKIDEINNILDKAGFSGKEKVKELLTDISREI